jgi:hypothetical protein
VFDVVKKVKGNKWELDGGDPIKLICDAQDDDNNNNYNNDNNNDDDDDDKVDIDASPHLWWQWFPDLNITSKTDLKNEFINN